MRVEKPQRLVYRLENEEGKGPFYGEQTEVPYLKNCQTPHSLCEAMGYPIELIHVLTNMGFVCGWGTRRAYREFFHPGGMAQAKAQGYRCRIYRPDFALVLPDRQVLFLKPLQVKFLSDHSFLALSAFSGILDSLSDKTTTSEPL